MTTFEFIYAGFAVFGGTSFVILLVLQFIGIGDGIDADTGVDGGMDFDIDTDLDTGSHTDADASFKLLSFQSLVAFSLMFGLVGLAASLDEWHSGLAFGAAIGAGILAMWVIARIFKFAASLQSSGTQRIGDLTGVAGTVYTRIPADGGGKINVTVNNRLVELIAQSLDKTEIKTGEAVEIVKMLDSSTVIVKPIRAGD